MKWLLSLWNFLFNRKPRFKSLGDRMKWYEMQGRKLVVLDHTKFTVIRIDGKNFSKLFARREKPWDLAITKAMHTVMQKLCKMLNASVGYTQSDEITLIVPPLKESAQYWYGGEVFKWLSILASGAAAEFQHHTSLVAMFDCRIFQVDDAGEAVNAIIWRVQDCKRNAIQSVAHYFFSTKQLHKKNGYEMIDMLQKLELNWEKDIPEQFKYGVTYAPALSSDFLVLDWVYSTPCKNLVSGVATTDLTNYSLVVSYDSYKLSEVWNTPNLLKSNVKGTKSSETD